MLFPFRSKLNIFSHILMLEEHVSITEVAGNELRVEDEVTNVNLGLTGLLDGVDLVEASS